VKTGDSGNSGDSSGNGDSGDNRDSGEWVQWFSCWFSVRERVSVVQWGEGGGGGIQQTCVTKRVAQKFVDSSKMFNFSGGVDVVKVWQKQWIFVKFQVYLSSMLIDVT
jgi:hypothetical protein